MPRLEWHLSSTRRHSRCSGPSRSNSNNNNNTSNNSRCKAISKVLCGCGNRLSLPPLAKANVGQHNNSRCPHRARFIHYNRRRPYQCLG
mmetsp:Transcript_25482/g.54032  ORF Transcript_25482/g.54032 Transcript_25482/m.54032 type:complete len:89 (+) Transcript_25482:485-751(+)